MSARTITFGDVAENGPGMQQLGIQAEVGLSLEDLQAAAAKFMGLGCDAELIDLRPAGGELTADADDSAMLLVVRGALEALGASAEVLETEQAKLTPDKQAFMRGAVKNKRARWNLCFDDVAQSPDLERKRGTVVPFSELPALSAVRAALPNYLGPKAAALKAELNVYYDLAKCGIGFHGDAERTVTIGIRLGDSFPFEYQWFHRHAPVGERIRVELGHGDLYIMGAKAVGTDWRRSVIPTLRHAAGAPKYLVTKRR